jgi:signal peptidase I
MKNSKAKWFFLIVICLGAGCAVFLMPLVIRTYVVQAFKIPSGAMEPTLLIGDYILVDKKAHTIEALTRKDIIVFKFPKDPSKDYVKRIIGLPGETLEIVDKEIFIDGVPLKENYVIHADPIFYPSGSRPRDNFGPIKIPNGHLFVMGDNRDQSFDSRYWGFVEESKVKGKVMNIYWSWDKKRNHIRWDRIGKKVN